MKKLFVAAVLVLTLAGCASFRIGEPYDPAMDDALNGFQKSSAAFIKSMQLNAGTTAGSYRSDGAKKYYAEATATLSNLELRAAMLSSRTCPVAQIANLTTAIGLPGVTGQLAKADAAVGATSASPQATGVSGNCMQIMVRNVVLAETNLEADHREADKLTPTVALLDSQEIDAAVRVALTALRSKKY